MATPTAVPIRGALNTNSPSDESVPTDLSSDSEVESGLDVESNTTPAGEVFSVDSHVWETKVRAIQQRIKKLSKMDTHDPRHVMAGNDQS